MLLLRGVRGGARAATRRRARPAWGGDGVSVLCRRPLCSSQASDARVDAVTRGDEVEDNGRDGGGIVVVGVETSCDDTGVGVLRVRQRSCRAAKKTGVGIEAEVLANVVSSQFEIHREYGGIVPRLAARAHEANLPLVVEQALEQAKLSWKEVDAIAVTTGPGLSPCLWAGIRAAEDYAAQHAVPVVAVNHLEGHALIPRLFEDSPAAFPFLTLIASGGHTLLVHVNGVRDYTLVAQSLDDAIGECFDKVARVMGCDGSVSGHPGKEVERLAAQGNPEAIPFRVPLTRSHNVRSCDFSFSGLKSAVRRYVGQRNAEPLSAAEMADVAAGFQHAALTHLENSTRRALVFSGCRMEPAHLEKVDVSMRRKYNKDVARMPDEPLSARPPRSLVVSGGVASNAALRQRLERLANCFGIPLHVPPPRLCTDNGVMIAWAGAELVAAGPGRTLADLRSHADTLAALPRWPLNTMSSVHAST
ncbi:tRNA N6-adenosine threonylcarbamoyltransferase [Hondaea fermentalgiana]|uniref:N(6)-L-threonylcarbamoyladenine synthase n=1 Tax=Hondaea fermentalgiana TaxID=2315210 RepID=A0A2R5GN38_9STRA|nr:tRNA N6-adenosine threonylcarbamoyltransferase [Hondaea fermentalgiana]|eukprot:GBG29284.1 tRNA N6-adenosine threonylcarbamoyltransferase [Hondaea fermentalgiana]